MNKRIEKFIYEAPLVYDDETEEKLGDWDSESGSYWGELPKEHANTVEIEKFLKDCVVVGTIHPDAWDVNDKERSGASRTIAFNDGKTVFKYNYNVEKFGDQTANELYVYKKYYSQFKDVIPKIYKHGRNWMIVQKLNEWTEDRFWNATKIKKLVSGTSGNVWAAYMNTVMDILEYIPFDEFKKFVGKSPESVKEYIRDNCGRKGGKIADSYTPFMQVLTNNKNVNRILEFCSVTGVDMGDLHTKNIMFDDKGNMMVSDFGLNTKHWG